MKKTTLISLAMLMGIFLMCSVKLHAQDVSTIPGVTTKVLLENDKVKVIEAEFPAGAVTKWHSHPNHVVNALTDGKMEITDKGKKPVIIELKAGAAMYLPAVTHMAKNIGTATVKMIITEMKPQQSKTAEAKPTPTTN